MSQILQLRVDDSTMEAIAELGKRQYPSNLPDRHGEALGYDRRAVLNDILSAGLAALNGDGAAASTPQSPAIPTPNAVIPQEGTAWLARLEALEAEVSRLSQALDTDHPATSLTPRSPQASTKPTTPPATPPDGVAPASATLRPTVPSASVAPTPPLATTQPVAKSLTPVTQVVPSQPSAPRTNSSVKQAKTPSRRRRRSSSRISSDEIEKLQDAPSLSKNGLASLCRCDKRTLDRKRDDGELGKFTRARCGVEYTYKASDTRYYRAT